MQAAGLQVEGLDGQAGGRVDRRTDKRRMDR
jgi:hypothetical protein